MATIKDVARVAGVSVSTASLAFNHPSRVAEETRQRVLEAAQQMQYRPTGAARDLRARRTDIIAVLLRDLSGPFYSELIQGVQDEADRCQYSVVIAHSNRRDAIGRLLYENRVDGAVLLDPTISDEVVIDLAEQNVPIVVLDRDLSHPYLMAISADHENGAYEATQYLIKAGYRDILFLGGPHSSLDAELRFRGYRRALLDAHLTPPERPVLRGDFTEASGVRETERLLATMKKPEAIFAANDEMALGVLHVLRQHHIRVPDDVALMGFDDIRIAQYVVPSLSTVRQPMYELGREAMRQLVCKLSGKSVNPRVVLPTFLVIRESTPPVV
ncbi:MAG: LacI family DNA-binding transcriptional regulator [Firmicutes bacterium]|nr:LacI family DNA-binding transcriptional regulator [Bacillota bacterium]